MKTYILFLCLFIAASTNAQKYKHFKVDYEGYKTYTLSPIKTPTQLKAATKDISNVTSGLCHHKYEVTNGDELGRQFFVYYNDIFKNMAEEQLELLKNITYQIIFDKNLQSQRYTLDFPIAEMKRFPEFENLLYHFGEKCLQVDISSYIRPLVKDEFEGSSITLPLFWMMRYNK